MPLYDYICQDCQKRFDIFLTYAEYGSRPVACPACGSKSTRRRIPRVRVAKSEDSRMDSLAGDFSDPAALAGLENALSPREGRRGRESVRLGIRIRHQRARGTCHGAHASDLL